MMHPGCYTRCNVLALAESKWVLRAYALLACLHANTAFMPAVAMIATQSLIVDSDAL